MSVKQSPSHSYLELNGICRQFGNVRALDDVSLSVQRGEIICLVGQSGCGKSTLLRVIAGIDKPDSGRVRLDGREISGPTSYVEPEERNIGIMFQDYALFPHLSVADNIVFGLKRLDRRAAKERSRTIIAQLGLTHLADRFPHMLSGGEQQRVALARALAPQPQILLMDEPFSNLDRGLREGVRTETLAVLRELGTTVIMVTHDPEEALSSGDRVVLMRAGEIVQEGTGNDLYDRPTSAYTAEFFCSFNKVQGACWNGFLETPLGRFEAPGFTDGETATLYIRPQCLRLTSNGDGVDCTVVDCALMGEIEQTLLTVAALSEPLKIRSTERQGLRSGDLARVSVAPEQVFVF
jgi:iron(III) transport system ATP-binding protein